jgi:hypothetical protein
MGMRLVIAGFVHWPTDDITLVQVPLPNGTVSEMYYVILRGATDAGGAPVAPVIGGYALPSTARLKLLRVEWTLFQPLQLVPLVQVAQPGALLMTVLQVRRDVLDVRVNASRSMYRRSGLPIRTFWRAVYGQ